MDIVDQIAAQHGTPFHLTSNASRNTFGVAFVSTLDGALPVMPGDTDLVSLLYRSRATVDFSPDLLENLVRGARVRNQARHVTGALYFERDCFMQWLEGPAPTVSQLFGEIGQDRRHTDVEVLSFGRSVQRVFGDWNLRLFHGFADLPRVGTATLDAGPPDVIDDLQRLRSIALALTRGRVGEFAIALEQAGSDLRLQVTLCERIMRLYAELWGGDECTEVDVVLGLALAQSQFRLHRARFPAHMLAQTAEAVLVVPVPGDRHSLGASLAQASLEEQGYGVPVALPETTDELLQLLQERCYGHAVIVGSGVFPRTHRIEAIRSLSDRLRTQLPEGATIGLYGALAAVRPSVITACGCDYGDGSALSLPGRIAPLRGALH